MMSNRLGIIKSDHTPEPHEEEECASGIYWQGKSCYFNEELFIPKIYVSYGYGLSIPEDFNAVAIAVDPDQCSSDKSKEIYSLADQAIAKGVKIVWRLNLGVFGGLKKSLSDESQLRSLSSSIDRFVEVIWDAYALHSLGVCLYTGKLDLTAELIWDDVLTANMREWLKERYHSLQEFIAETALNNIDFHNVTPDVLKSCPVGQRLLQLYSCDAGIGYIDLLAQYFPADVECFALVDATEIDSPLWEGRLRSKERANRVRLVTQNSRLSPCDLVWGSGPAPYGYISDQSEAVGSPEAVHLGLCLPDSEREQIKSLQALDEVAMILDGSSIKYRIVHEAYLTVEWECLDFLIVCSDRLSTEGRRKLQGFCAAGGTVVTIGQMIGLPEEIPFEEWKRSLMIKP